MPAKRLFTEVCTFMAFAWNHFQASQCRQGAAALTYTSLFALVPMMTVSYVVLSFMPQLESVHKHIETLIFSNFVPETGNQVKSYLDQFSHQARKLTVPGILMLIITSLMMLKTIENTFNTIWDLQRGRRGVSSFLLYWAVLSLGPVLAGAGLMFSTYLLSLDFLDGVEQMKAIKPFAQLIPWLLTSTALCLIYIAVPNCRVSFRSAAIGAAVAGLAFELAKSLFALSVKHSSYTLIYGAFASVPLFLLWIYTCWIIVLAGAVLVRCLHIYPLSRTATHSPFLLALILLRIFWRKQQQGPSVKAVDLIRGLDMGIGMLGVETWEHLRDLLMKECFIRATAEGDYVLTRDLHSVTLHDLARLFGANYSAVAPETPGLSNQSWFNTLTQALGSIEQHAKQTLSISLAELYAQD